MLSRPYDQLFKSLFILMLVFLLAACDGGVLSPSPTLVPAPTTTPLAAPTSTAAPTKKPVPTTLPATPTIAPAVSVARIAVLLPDNSVRLVDTNGSQTLLAKLDNQVDLPNILAAEGELGSPLYLPVTGNPPTVMQIDANGARKLDWITGPLYGIAGTSSQLAWGTADIHATMMAARIQISGLDGSGVKTALEETYSGVGPQDLRVLRWSQDGTRLYFSKEPLGIGGYYLFAGLTNLWSLDVSSGKATEVVHKIASNAAICIDDLSSDETQVADHCKVNGMEVINLATKAARVITPPPDIPQFGVVGGARFSPDGSRLAYALARRDPSNEQGWVAVSEGTSGTSRLIATSPAQDYFWVAAWLDSDTMVLQSGMWTSPQGVWTVRADGSHLKRLADGIFLGIVGRSSVPTAVPTLAPSPVMTPTPRQPSSIGQIVFASNRDGNLEIYLMNLTELPQGTGGIKPVRLTKTQTRNGPPVPSPDGKRIAFVAETDVNGTLKDREIYVMNLDGSGLTDLTNNPAIDQEPAWSPDGMRIAFASNREGDPYSSSIYTMKADGTDVRRLAPNGNSPAWSPDGKRITFLSSRDQQIYIVNADGSNLQRLTNSPAPGNGTAQGAPVWSPDGKQIAFRSNRDGNSEIYVMNPDGSGQTNLTRNKAYDDFPVWSPDSKWIAFISNRDGQAGLYATLAPHAIAGTNTGASDVIRLTKGSAFAPRWSPDGRWIVYVGDSGDGNQDIYLVSAGGGESVNLTNHPAQDTFPVWLP